MLDSARVKLEIENPLVSTIDIWVLARTELPAALTEHLGDAPVQRDPNGKPWVAGGPHFNLSHSGALALLGICADLPIGVDLEAVRPLRQAAGLARRIATPRELAHLNAQGEPGTPAFAAALLHLWVRKEAVAKAEGGGISTALAGIDVLDPLVGARGARWFVHDLTAPAPGYLAAVAWPADPP